MWRGYTAALSRAFCHHPYHYQSMTCLGFTFPKLASTDALETMLNNSLGFAFDLSRPDQINSFISNIYCSADSLQCLGICPNADLAGVGVRTAFWLSSTLQALVVAISPRDSTQGAWTSTVLTASILIPAIKQKRQRLLSLYHASLVLNFATFSSLVSLVVAPMCTVWRQRLNDENSIPERDDEPPDPSLEITEIREEGEILDTAAQDSLTNLPKRRVHRQRLVLSLALLAQVSLQWTWVVIMFTDPEYAQTICSPYTKVLLFGKTFTAHQINTEFFSLWLLWLIFNLGITLVWGILLVHSSSPSVHPVLSRHPSRVNIQRTLRDRLPSDKGRICLLAGNSLAFLIAVLLLATSEVQVEKNCVLGGENTEWSIGQFAAILLALTPAWSIVNALARRGYDRFNQILPVHRTDNTLLSSCSSTVTATPSSRVLTPSPRPIEMPGAQYQDYLTVPDHSRRRLSSHARINDCDSESIELTITHP